MTDRAAPAPWGKTLRRAELTEDQKRTLAASLVLLILTDRGALDVGRARAILVGRWNEELIVEALALDD